MLSLVDLPIPSTEMGSGAGAAVPGAGCVGSCGAPGAGNAGIVGGGTTTVPPSLLAASFALEPQLEPNQKSTTVESLDSSAPKPTQSTGSKGESALPMMISHAMPANVEPSLLIAPASLIANWAAEIARSAPSLKAMVVHPSATPSKELKAAGPDNMADVDLVITSYGYLARAPWLKERAWRLVVIDEAQAVKNAEAQQTRAVKQIKAAARIALTGTPIENRLGDLWSIFRLPQSRAARVVKAVLLLCQAAPEF